MRSRSAPRFSVTTMASSTTKPVEMRDGHPPTRTGCRGVANGYMSRRWPTTRAARAMLGMRVARALRRKTKTDERHEQEPAPPRMLACARRSARRRDARLGCDPRTEAVSMAGEIDRAGAGSACPLMRSSVARMLAPGSRRTIMRTGALPSIQRERLFSTSSETRATSPRRTAARPDRRSRALASRRGDEELVVAATAYGRARGDDEPLG